MNIMKIEGIGPVYARKLEAIGIRTTEKLLERGATRHGRQKIEQATGIARTQILDWVNRADLMRIPGVGQEYSDLLEAASVDTVRELSRRRAESLMSSLKTANQSWKLVRKLPSPIQVTRWIEAAKELPPIITY